MSSDKSLRQSATEMWCLGRYFPLLIGDLVSEDDEHWSNMLTLCEIVDNIFGPKCSSKSLDHLDHLIRLFLTQFKTLYPDQSIIPKMHYLIHYPSCMRRFGPLSRHWCMRFEAKNNYFKEMAHVIGNYKNIAKTLSLRHQRLSCYYLQGSQIDLEFGKGRSFSVGCLEEKRLILETFTDYNEETAVIIYPWVKVRSQVYKPGYVLIKEIKDDVPQLCVIKLIIVSQDNTIYFIVDKLHNIEYCWHYHACYTINKEREITLICKLSDFCDHHAYNFHQSFNSSLNNYYFIVQKYLIF
ncbi:PREDICTED: uncharacterized protein LOC109588897 [Amphimedon queenslandica]|uniref:DUF4218 domain-containing protein n=2 Tax=Amphimedon queenslandica TaxID=400682 RepID=A0AAN0JUL5_AMPQE|nr:PREDICTED: uncharacterized protein LOC109588897 [Amphimedon queenslandica]|eukprot:XP_019860559.1 PREDICTED: uncharacterized protein LOC109588897 [Amphimedon queenslandica]